MIMIVTFQDEFRNQLVTSLRRQEYEVCVPSHNGYRDFF